MASNRGPAKCLLRGNLVCSGESVGILTIKGDRATFGLPNRIMGVIIQRRDQPGLKYLTYHDFNDGGDGASEERQMFLGECDAWWRQRRRVISEMINVRGRTYQPLTHAALNTSTESFRRAASMVTKHLCFLQNQVCGDRLEAGRRQVFFRELPAFYKVDHMELNNTITKCVVPARSNDLKEKDPLATDFTANLDTGRPEVHCELGARCEPKVHLEPRVHFEEQPKVHSDSVDQPGVPLEPIVQLEVQPESVGQPRVHCDPIGQPKEHYEPRGQHPSPLQLAESRPEKGCGPEGLPDLPTKDSGQLSTHDEIPQSIKREENGIINSDYLEHPSSEQLLRVDTIWITPPTNSSSLVTKSGFFQPEPDPLLDISKFNPPYQQGKHLNFVQECDAFGKPTGTLLKYERTVLRRPDGSELWYLKYPVWDRSQKIPVRKLAREILEIIPSNGLSTKLSQFLHTGSVDSVRDSDQCIPKFLEIIKSRCKANLLGETPAHLKEDFLTNAQKRKREKWLQETKWNNHTQEGTIMEADLMETPCKISPIYFPNYFK